MVKLASVCSTPNKGHLGTSLFVPCSEVFPTCHPHCLCINVRSDAVMVENGRTHIQSRIFKASAQLYSINFSSLHECDGIENMQ